MCCRCISAALLAKNPQSKEAVIPNTSMRIWSELKRKSGLCLSGALLVWVLFLGVFFRGFSHILHHCVVCGFLGAEVDEV